MAASDAHFVLQYLQLNATGSDGVRICLITLENVTDMASFSFGIVSGS
jgi:hypothetical protein